MKTAAYTICKNEIKFVEKWLYYTKDFTYRVLLDTGSTDGTWELLQEVAKTDTNLILEQKIIEPWRFDTARNYNLSMVPKDCEWCLSPDLDEYFSINVLHEIKNILKDKPNATNISCDRLDIFSDIVRHGPPNTLPINKIHRRNDYTWSQPVFEHMLFNRTDITETEVYNNKIFLIHDQDFNKPERTKLYVKLLHNEYELNPTNCWTLWYLISHYYITQDLDNFIKYGRVFLDHANHDDRYTHVRQGLEYIYFNIETSSEQKAQILETLGRNKP